MLIMLIMISPWLAQIRANTGTHHLFEIRGKYGGQIRGHITYLILAIEKITAKRNGYVNELSYVSPDYWLPDYHKAYELLQRIGA